MKIFKHSLALILAVVLLLPFGLAACGGESDGLVDGKAVVTFDPNLEGTGFFESDVTSVRDQLIEPGKTATEVTLVVKGTPANPRNLGFKEWCVDKEGTTPYDFSTPVTKSMTLYAHWVSRYVVTYHIGLNVKTANVFPGETAPDMDGEVGAKKIYGWFTDEAKTQAYDFSTPVNANLDLYVKTSDGIYLTAERLNTLLLFNYGDVTYKAPDDDSSMELIGSGEDAYLKVHFARIMNSSYMYINNLNEFLVTPGTTTRVGDEMTITYKNLGEATHIRFWYVVGYHQGVIDGVDYGYWYSPMPTSKQNVGRWQAAVNIPIQSNMSESDDWATVTVNLYELAVNVVDGISYYEWQNADILCIPRWDAVKSNGSGSFNGFFYDNDLLFKSIEFNSLGTAGQ